MINNHAGNPTSAPPLEPLLVTPATAAKMLSLSEKTLWTLANRGEIPRLKIGRAVRFDPADLRAWITKNKTTATATPLGDQPGGVAKSND